jgi:pyruvate/2-oxoacid:ferredoxin oxidoreductase alpha subunit
MKKILTANHAVSWAVKLARVDVVAAYPITPQTSIVEEISEMVARNEIDSKFIHSESEHSSMSACIGASMTGARTFTATSSQGLAYMHEMLHWAAGGRVPVVMAEVNRSLAPPWTIYTDQQDSLSQRDTGWMQFYCRDAQEVLDTTLLCFKVAERVNLPAMLVLDAFILSHTNEAVDVPDAALVDKFLPKRVTDYKLDTKNPQAFGGMMNVDCWMETRVQLQKAMEEAVGVVEGAVKEWATLTGRSRKPIDAYRMEDAEVAILAAGTAAQTSELTVDRLREQGVKAGALELWMFRPFPVALLRELTRNLKTLLVLDRSCSYGHSGIFAQECRSALYDQPTRPQIEGVIAGLGGREISPEMLVETVKAAVKGSGGLISWGGVRE